MKLPFVAASCQMYELFWPPGDSPRLWAVPAKLAAELPYDICNYGNVHMRDDVEAAIKIACCESTIDGDRDGPLGVANHLVPHAIRIVWAGYRPKL